MDRQTVSSGAPWESIAGYSRAVRVGALVFVAGTTAVDESGQVIAAGDPYGQTRFTLQKIDTALQHAGAALADVVRTRMFVTNMEDWEAVARAHGEVFQQIKPAATLVEVTSLIAPELLVEIEVDAVIASLL